MEIAILIIASLILVLLIVCLIKLFTAKAGDLSFKNEIDSAIKVLTATFNAANTVAFERIEKDNKDKLESLEKFTETNKIQFKEIRKELFETIDSLQQKITNSLRETREDTFKSFNLLKDDITKSLKEVRENSSLSLEKVREENSRKLDEIRGVVDEKLQETLEKRFNEKFKLISDRLETVHQGLGEMRSLSEGVKDIKEVFNNVKNRGTWSEKNLESMLSDTIPGQYYTQYNVKGRENSERVDFAIRMPGTGDGEVVLPIDSKFPIEDYLNLIEACKGRDVSAQDKATKEFAAKIKSFAIKIRTKYISPPKTTNYAIMYLPSEGIYAEIMQNEALLDNLLNQNSILPAGPSSILALLNTLKIGFKSVAIEKSANEIVKSFNDIQRILADYDSIIDKAQNNIEKAGKNMEEFRKKNKSLTTRLKQIDSLEIAKRIEN